MGKIYIGKIDKIEGKRKVIEMWDEQVFLKHEERKSKGGANIPVPEDEAEGDLLGENAATQVKKAGATSRLGGSNPFFCVGGSGGGGEVWGGGKSGLDQDHGGMSGGFRLPLISGRKKD